MSQQMLDWTADSECAICHKVEDASLQNADCPQASGHADLECVQCHTEEPVLETAHDGVAYNDVPAEEATVVSVDPATCQDPACHGTLEEMAVKTADLDTFKDEKGKVQNPHDYESNEQHDAHQPVCTDCHKINGRFARPRRPPSCRAHVRSGVLLERIVLIRLCRIAGA